MNKIACGALMNQIILSICIPTYNRENELRQTIESIVQQDGFDNKIEVLIVDNASTDNTEKMVREYINRYNNIVYVRNDTNIGADRNIAKAAFLGHGRYVKLLNDNKSINSGVLSMWKELYSTSYEAVIFNYNYPGKSTMQNTFTKPLGTDKFFYKVSYYLTWLGGLSFNKELLMQIDPSELDYTTCLVQTEILVKMLKKSGTAKIVYCDWCYEPKPPKRSGYNYFKVFNNNFVLLLNEAEKSELMTCKTKKKIKTDLLKYHTFPVIWNMLIHPSRYRLGKKKSIYYLYKNFGTCVMLYLFPLWIIFKTITYFYKNKICFLSQRCRE